MDLEDAKAESAFLFILRARILNYIIYFHRDVERMH
jgi:hypothetical protein